MGSKSQVAGFKYYMPLHFVSALCRGPTASGITVRDCLFEIRMGERTGWTGAIYENGTITINAPELFGGDEAEGGIVGQADVMFGAPDQVVNAYLAAEQGDPQSAHRGLFSVVWKGGQVCSNSPYLKPWAFARRRITGGWYGECWYPEKAPIPLSDAGSGSTAYDILITGSSSGSAVFAVAETGVAPVPVAIPASTGADEGGMVGAYHDGKWVAASQYGTRVLDGPLSTTASWTTGTLTGAARTVEFVGASDDGEWAAKDWTIASSGSTSFNTILAGDPSSMSAVTTSGTNSLGVAFTMRHQLLRFVGGYWYSAQARGIFRSPTLSETFTAVWDEYDSAGAGWDPNGATIIGFYDVVKSGSDTYFIVEWHFDAGLHRIRIWRSPDGGYTMDEANVEWDQDGTDAPRQLIEVGGKVVALCSNYDVITNASGSFQRVSTGMPFFPEAGGASGIGLWKAPKIATDGERVYIVGGSYMVVSADKGVTWGDPITLPISSAKSITVGVPASVPGQVARYCMNPAHIVYQCLTDPNCLGYPTAVIDEANFAAAADQLYAEGLGLNLKWTNRETIENFIGIVCDHAGMIVVRDRRTGLYKLRLLRDDYEIEDLRVFTPSNSRILSAQRPSPADFVNELQVTYTDYKTFKEATVPVRDVAAIQAMGRVVSKSHSLTGLPTESLAARCGERDLGAMAKPLWRIDLSFNRNADELEPGEPFLLDYPPSEIFPDGLYLVLRVADEINYGTAAAGEITAKCVQDVFSLPATANTGSLPDIDDGSPGDPEPAVAQAFEVPYRDLLLAMGQTDVAALEDDAGYVALVAKRPGRGYRGFGMATRIDPVAFSTVAAGLFSPTCTLSADIAPLQTVLPLMGWMDAGGVEPGDALIIGEGREAEWVRVDAIAGDASTVTVGRGCADTVPHAWPAGTRVWAYEGYAASDPSQYIADETIDVKALPRTLEAELALDDADLLQVDMASRAARPLPPGGLLLNGAPFYEVGGPVTPTPPGGGGGGGGGTTTPSTPPALDKYGNPASSSPGPNGGFADDAPDPLPQPEIFDTDIVGSDGGFGDPGALANWRNNDGSALSAEWSIDSGRLRYHGRSTYAIAVHWPSRMRMAIQPSAGAIVSVAANVQTDGFGPPAGGSPVGATIGADRTAAQVAASYPVATDVTYSHDYQIDVPGVTAYGVYNLPAATPCVAVYNPAGDLVTCWWDDFTAEVSDPDVPMTAFVPANIDFPGDDLTGWVTFAGLMDEDIAGGELQATCTDAAGSTRYYINTDAIPVTDVGQRIRMRAEVWSNDTTTTLAGTDRITANGVALGIALRDSVGNYYYSQYAYVFQRGDWTQREWWQEVTTISGMTYHALFAVRAGEGFAGGIRDIEIDYTTDPATR